MNIDVGPIRVLETKAKESIYEQAKREGVFTGSFEDFLRYLRAPGLTDEVQEEIRRAVAEEIRALNLSPKSQDEQPNSQDLGTETPSEQPVAAEPITSDVSDAALAEVFKILGG